MASDIDATKPVAGSPTTQSVRDNFATAASEITALQTAPNQTITLSGDISGTGTSAIPTTLPTVNTNVGTWNNVTINAKGLATAGSNVAYVTGGPYLALAGGTLTGPIMLPAGTAAANSVQMVNPGTGMFGIAAGNQLAVATSGVERVRIDNNGNVGIGTAGPGAKLQVNGGVVIGNPAPNPGQGGLVLNAAASAPQANADNPQLWFASEGITECSGDSYGNFATYWVGRRARGTAAAPTALQSGDVITQFGASGRGATNYGAGGFSQFRATENWSDTAHGTAITFSTVTNTTTTIAEAMRIHHNGNVGIGTTAPGSLLTVNGVCANVSGVWTTISDASVKENVTPYTRGLDAIVALSPVEFRYAKGTPFAEADKPSRQLFGLIADEVKPHVPEIVGTTTATIGKKEGVELSTLEPGNLIYALINAVKELNGQREEMVARMAALESATVH